MTLTSRVPLTLVTTLTLWCSFAVYARVTRPLLVPRAAPEKVLQELEPPAPSPEFAMWAGRFLQGEPWAISAPYRHRDQDTFVYAREYLLRNDRRSVNDRLAHHPDDLAVQDVRIFIDLFLHRCIGNQVMQRTQVHPHGGSRMRVRGADRNLPPLEAVLVKEVVDNEWARGNPRVRIGTIVVLQEFDQIQPNGLSRLRKNECRSDHSAPPEPMCWRLQCHAHGLFDLIHQLLHWHNSSDGHCID